MMFILSRSFSFAEGERSINGPALAIY